MISINRISLFASTLLVGVLGASAQQSRPAITGISHMCVYASDPGASEKFYTHVLGATKSADPQDPTGVRFYFSPTQFVEVLPLPAQHSLSRTGCVAFSTANAESLHGYLQAHGAGPITAVQVDRDGAHWFSVKDPEGNLVQFLQPGRPKAILASAKPIGTHVIHVGYVVHSAAAEDHFYQELLGFKPYWFGAMQPGHVDWVSMQVPDGRDWMEYMLVGDGSDTPLDHVDQRNTGVMNHFSIGVPNIEAAVTTMIREDRLSPRHDGPQMGKDGKWQANVYDPDGTRVELMEFQAVTKPCCSPFTAKDPVR